MQGKCDAEIGSPRKGWHGCRRTATAHIWSAYGQWLEYCDLHHNHAKAPHMKPAPFASLEPIGAMTAQSETGE